MIKRASVFVVVLGVVVSFFGICKQPKNCGCSNSAPSASGKVKVTQPSMKVSDVSLSPLTLCQAIRKGAQSVSAPEDDIGPASKAQELFIDSAYVPFIKEKIGEKFTPQELQSYASRNYKELNEILANKGFSIRLPPFAPTNIGIVAIQDVLVKWLLEGTKDTLSIDQKQYDALVLKVDSPQEGSHMGQQNIHFFAHDASSIVVVQLLTQSEDMVYIVTKRDGNLFDKQPSVAEISKTFMQYRDLMKSGKYPSADDSFNSVRMPMISYDEQPDVSWLEKMRVGTAHVGLALQQVIFKMNEKGARAQAAVAMILMTSYPGMKHKEQLLIDKPFLIWIERPGVPLPIFAGYMEKKYWKNPGSLQ